MMNLNDKKQKGWCTKILIIIITILYSPSTYSQTVKQILISNSESYTDHIALATDATDKDLMVKFQFNEDENTLTVSIISYRMLFVFWENTPYKGTIGYRRKIRLDRLPFVATSNPDDHFRLSKSKKKSIPKPRKKHIFRKWIEYEGLQPQEKELKMVNDYIEQTFDIQNRRLQVKVHLRDLMFLDVERRKGNITKYAVGDGKDIDTEYQINILRNPCFGLDEETTAANNALSAIKKSYSTLKEKYGSGTVKTNESLQAFNEIKQTVIEQYPQNTEISACPDIQVARDQYNIIADSIQSLNVVLETPMSAVEKVMGSKKGRAINVKTILYNARLIDNSVAKWLRSKDETERRDLERTCRNLIKETRLFINNGKAISADEQNAVKIFLKAEQYFNTTCR